MFVSARNPPERECTAARKQLEVRVEGFLLYCDVCWAFVSKRRKLTRYLIITQFFVEEKTKTKLYQFPFVFALKFCCLLCLQNCSLQEINTL